MIRLERLKEILSYDPVTGLWTWLEHYHGSRYVGTIAGTKTKGYIYILINKKRYLAHRLAFFYMTGEWPKLEIDHKDTIKSNNKWDNLREASPKQNMHNRPATKRSKLGVKGVTYHVDRKVYQVQMSLGTYKTLEEAKTVYEDAAKKLHGAFYRA